MTGRILKIYLTRRIISYIRKSAYMLKIMGYFIYSMIFYKRTKKIRELIDYIEKAAYILKGMTNGTSIKAYLISLLLFKRINDICDEDYKTALGNSSECLDYGEFCKNHKLKIPEKCHWEDIKRENTKVGEALESALNGIAQTSCGILFELFKYTQWNSISDEKMIKLIEHLSTKNLSAVNVPDVIMNEGYAYIQNMDDGWYCCAVVDQM